MPHPAAAQCTGHHHLPLLPALSFSLALSLSSCPPPGSPTWLSVLPRSFDPCCSVPCRAAEKEAGRSFFRSDSGHPRVGAPEAGSGRGHLGAACFRGEGGREGGRGY